MANKKTGQLNRVALSALAFCDVNADDIGSGMNDLLSAHLEEGEEANDLRLVVRQIARIVRPILEAANQADRAHACAMAQAAGTRRKLEVAATEVRSQMIFIRRLFWAHYGRRRGNLNMGLIGPTPAVAQPIRLFRQGEHTLELLRQADFEPPERKTKSRRIDLEALTDDLEPAHKTLEKAIDAHRVAGRRLWAASAEKAAATKKLKAKLRDYMGFVASMCPLIGKPELGRRLTASVRRLASRKR